MTRLVAFYQSWLVRDESGASIVEYAILVALIAVALMGVIGLMTGRIGDMFEQVPGGAGDDGGGNALGLLRSI